MFSKRMPVSISAKASADLFRIIVSILFLNSMLNPAKATVYRTAQYGYWHTQATWQNLTPPSYFVSDTIIIEHAVAINEALTFLSGAYLKIEQEGGLCGHVTINMSGNQFISYGLLQVDVINISAGSVIFNPPGTTILTQYGSLSGTGNIEVNGTPLEVGPWFECQLPEYESVGLQKAEAIAATRIKFTPNPFRHPLDIRIESDALIKAIQIIDPSGKIVYQIKGQVPITFQGPNLQPGLYYILTLFEDQTINRQAIVHIE